MTIEYELAPLYQRLLAFLLDLAVVVAAYFLLFLIGLWIIGYGSAMTYYTYLVLIPVVVFYTPVLEIFLNGQTIGKLALGIRCVKLSGKQATAGDYMVRWLFSIIDIYLCIGSIAAILISSTDKNQRIGDIVANTVIIKLRPSRVLGLRDLLNIHSIDNYQPRYPEVKYLSEEDMLLVKTVLERHRKYANDAHRDAMDELIKKLMPTLNVVKLQQEKYDFLRTILNDYIVLTR